MRSRRWQGFRSVLCPVDFSEASRLALRCAAAVAARGGGRLTVMYVNDPLLVAAARAALRDRQLVRRSAAELQRFAAATIGGELKAARIRSRVSIGVPADEIVKASVAARCDLVVMGTHGMTGAGRLIMGSTTLGVLQQTTVPVLAVPLLARDVSFDRTSWPGEQIVAAIELDDRSREDVERASAIAEWFGSSLLLLHVIGDIDAPKWMAHALSGHERVRVAQAQQQLDALTLRARQRVRSDHRVVCGQPAHEMAALVGGIHARLLVTALRDRRGWFGARRGSMSYHVLAHAVVPVLACPPQWRPR